MSSAPRASNEAFAEFHPLEILPWFRRYRPGLGRNILYTFLFNCALSLFFWVLGSVFSASGFSLLVLVWVVLVSNIMGFMIHGLMSLSAAVGLERRMRSLGNVVSAAYYTGISTIGILGGYFILGITADARIRGWFSNPRWIAGIALTSFIISTILLTIVVLREREARAEAALARERAHSERVEREAAHAELRALQAQIEPHFLFNTLANVASLVDADPALAKRMLERFIRFLRASLAATRGETTTLAAEADLIGAYLDVLQVRMGARMRHTVEVDPSLAAFELPPMLLQPLVENAIRHGLEPRVEGGEVRMSARREGASVLVEIRDSGVGFAPTTRGGTGLTNLRDRLRVIYGERATLDIAENPGGGTVVTLRLPA